jgi:hydrophobic/amphiphilic exporter-1 (mainly G- bacteria), HAE1 family
MLTYLRHPVAVASLFATVIISGILISSYLPVELLPSLKYPRLVVISTLSNASSEEVETLLTRQIEESVGTVSGLKSINSISAEGISSVVLRFDWGTNMSIASAEVREKLDLIAEELPREAKQPIVIQYDPTDTPVITLALTSDQDVTSLRGLAQDLRKELEILPGVAAIRLGGGREQEIQVLADRSRLFAHGLDLRTLSNRVETANVNFPGGKILQGHLEFPVRTVGRFRNLEEIESVSLGRGGEGVGVRVRDVAIVQDGTRDRTSLNKVNGEPAVLLGIIKESSANSINISKLVMGKLPELQKSLPKGSKLQVVDNEAPFVEQSLKDLRKDMMTGSLLAFIVLLVGLRNFSSSLLISLSIPASVFSTLSFMYLAGVNVNVMSIAGMALGVGMLVDCSIVVLEAIHRRKSGIPDTLEAVVTAIREVGSSVVAGTLTTLVALVPIMFMSGLAQRLFKDFAFTLGCSLAISTLTALVLLPSLVVWGNFSRGDKSETTRGPSNLQSVYGFYLAKALDNSWKVVLACVFIFLASVLSLSRIGFEVLPKLNVGEFAINLTMPADSGIDLVEARVNEAEDWLKEIPDVSSFVTEAGAEQSKGGLEPAQASGKPNEAKIMVKLKPGSSSFQNPDIVIDILRARSSAWKDTKVDFAFRQGPLARVLGSTGIPELMRLSGDDPVWLNEIAQTLVGRLSGEKIFRDVKSEGNIETNQYRVLVDRNKASARGVTVEDVGQVVRIAIDGKGAGKFIRGDKEIDIRVRLSTKDKTSVDELKQLPLMSNRDELVLLGQISEVNMGKGPREILRSDRKRSVIIHSNVTGTSFSSGEAEAKRIAKSIEMPQGFEVGSGSEQSELSSSLGSLYAAFGLAVLLVYVLLVVQYESLLWPLVIFASIPMTIVGPNLILLLGGSPMNVLSLIGAVILVGIVVNNAILIVVHVNNLRAAGQDSRSAIINGASVRLNPILMTTLTAVFGALPLCLDFSGSAPLNRPLAVTITAGLSASTIFTLFLVPCVYSLLAGTRLGKIIPIEGENA